MNPFFNTRTNRMSLTSEHIGSLLITPFVFFGGIGVVLFKTLIVEAETSPGFHTPRIASQSKPAGDAPCGRL